MAKMAGPPPKESNFGWGSLERRSKCLSCYKSEIIHFQKKKKKSEIIILNP